jgi:hypothetical protein
MKLKIKYKFTRDPQNAGAGLSTSSNLDTEMNGAILLNVPNATSGVFVVNVTAESQANPDAKKNVAIHYSRDIESSKGGDRF